MENLIKKALRGDADAFTDLMMSQMQSLYKTARAILSNEEDAADAISDTILVCWEKLDTLQKPRYFRTWMTRILINNCRDILAERSRFVIGETLPEEAKADTGYADTEWNEALASIDEKYRLILILYYVEGYKSAEIGKILDLPESTVRTRLQRGRKYLAQMYEGEKIKTGGIRANSEEEERTEKKRRKAGETAEAAAADAGLEMFRQGRNAANAGLRVLGSNANGTNGLKRRPDVYE